MRTILALAAGLLLLTGCDVSQTTGSTSQGSSANPGPQVSAETAARNFVNVVNRVEPVAEQMCRAQTQDVNCDFEIIVDRRQGLPPNAFQTLDPNGRPIIGFTLSLLLDARNTDELAFILGHEAAHHIRGHIPQSRVTAQTGLLLGGALASLAGADAQGIEVAQRLGAGVGARRFSKEFELEADSLGAVIAHRSGFDPLRAANYFRRSPDPGNQFLGTHPPNAERIAIVQKTMANL